MAAPMRMDEGGAAPTKVTAEKSSQRRVNWSVSTTESLIRLWEDNLAALRSNTRNARIYDEMTRSLNARLPAGEVPFTAKQLRQKLENLNKQYRKLRRCGTSTGSKGVEWPFYWQLHAFLGTLPVNDSDLVEESVEVISTIYNYSSIDRLVYSLTSTLTRSCSPLISQE
ncbi:myb/SANT-like DNA-binding domain-containing protein 1 [Dermacentor silvarum]|uniref:myb/SANT-like DNA-binding domain-containing protein 1 n=1 Tax=Dermacentor silvarum TaxID=543639 RepID=UPI00210103B0|nr:myb/SANT-like DNA-binding domain-containing protein 1 [Dermacentor silvarum]